MNWEFLEPFNCSHNGLAMSSSETYGISRGQHHDTGTPYSLTRYLGAYRFRVTWPTKTSQSVWIGLGALSPALVLLSMVPLNVRGSAVDAGSSSNQLGYVFFFCSGTASHKKKVNAGFGSLGTWYQMWGNTGLVILTSQGARWGKPGVCLQCPLKADPAFDWTTTMHRKSYRSDLPPTKGLHTVGSGGRLSDGNNGMRRGFREGSV